jgi:tetratricopeptide (TPR) repeat protein
MNCPRCQGTITESARFCASCGSILQATDPAYQLSYAHRLETTGDLEGAVREYERLLEGSGMAGETAGVHKHLGNLHFRLGHLRAGRDHLARASALEPSNAAFWHDKAVIEYHMAEFDDAIDSLKEALRRDPDLHLAYFWLGNALYHRGDMDEAAASFRELLERFPNFAIARFHLGVIYERQGLREEASREFRRVLFQNPEDAAARYYVSGRGAGGATS